MRLTEREDIELAVVKLLGNEVRCRRLSLLGSTFFCEGRRGSLVAKVYDEFSTLKWVSVVPFSRPAIAFRVSSYERLVSELVYSVKLRKLIKTFKVFGVAKISGVYVLLREYVQGETLFKIKDPKAWRLLGRRLAEIHLENIALGDSNPGNFVVSNNEIAVVDLEQARNIEEGLAAWDLVTLLVHGHLRGVSTSLLVEALKGYGENEEARRRITRELSNLAVWTPYLLVAQPLAPFAFSAFKKAGYL
ncbi:MAG: lipopolysaccharide core heptose(II) kinase RfaY [Acidilobaceae archaeon]